MWSEVVGGGCTGVKAWQGGKGSVDRSGSGLVWARRRESGGKNINEAQAAPAVCSDGEADARVCVRNVPRALLDFGPGSMARDPGLGVRRGRVVE